MSVVRNADISLIVWVYLSAAQEMVESDFFLLLRTAEGPYPLKKKRV